MRAIFFLIKLGGWQFIGAGLLSLVAGMSSGLAIKSINESIHNGIPDMQRYLFVIGSSLLLFITSSVIASTTIVAILQRIVTALTKDFAIKILNAEYINTESNQDKLMSVFFHDINTISNLTEKIPNLFVSTTVVMVCSGYIFFLSSQLFLFLIGMIVLVGLSVFITNRPLRKVAQINRSIFDTYLQKTKHLIYGIRELKLNKHHYNYFINDEFQQTLENKRKNTVKERIIITSTDKIVESLALASIALMVLFFTYLSSDTNHDSFVEGFTMSLFLAAPLASVASFAKGLKTFNAAMNQISNLGLELDKKVAVSGDVSNNTSHTLPLFLKDIFFKYKTEKNDYTLSEINLTIQPATINFITGGNGSGKTTLGKVLTGLYTSNAGTIELNGQIVNDANLDNYRNHFTAIWNDNYLFEDINYTQWQNYDWNKKLKELELDNQLGIENGIYTNMKLSSGQQKRLAFLTSLLEDKPIWFFDEWAAYQDVHFKQLFYNKILPSLKSMGKTIIAITHDDQYFQIADQIITIKNGTNLN